VVVEAAVLQPLIKMLAMAALAVVHQVLALNLQQGLGLEINLHKILVFQELQTMAIQEALVLAAVLVVAVVVAVPLRQVAMV
jgi:hypothetical protein